MPTSSALLTFARSVSPVSSSSYISHQPFYPVLKFHMHIVKPTDHLRQYATKHRSAYEITLQKESRLLTQIQAVNPSRDCWYFGDVEVAPKHIAFRTTGDSTCVIITPKPPHVQRNACSVRYCIVSSRFCSIGVFTQGENIPSAVNAGHQN